MPAEDGLIGGRVRAVPAETVPPGAGEPPPGPGEPIDGEPPERAAPELFCQLSAEMLDYLVAMRTFGGEPDPAAVTELAGRSGGSEDLVRAAASPVAVTHVEVVRRGAGYANAAHTAQAVGSRVRQLRQAQAEARAPVPVDLDGLP